MVTEVSGWDPGHIYCGSGGLSFEPCRSGWLLMPSYGERLGDGAVCPLRRGVASSEAEMSHLLKGGSATLGRGGDLVTSSRVDPLPLSEVEIAQRV